MFDKSDLQILYRYSYSLTGDEDDAYDLLQASIEKYIKSNSVKEYSKAYVKKIIYNKFIDDCRRNKIIQFESLDCGNLEQENLPADFDVKTLEDLQVNENMAEQILQCLEPDEREIMYCWAIEGFSTSELAEKLNKPKGTILSKIYRMRTKILEKFSDNSSEIMEAKL